MSVINKKPFIHSVIESLDKTGLSTLQSILNTQSNNANFRSLINNTYIITSEDKGISRLVLECPNKVYTGAFVYNNSYCVLIAWNKDTDQKLKIVVVGSDKKSYEIIEQPLSINELRRLVEVSLIEAGGVEGYVTEGELQEALANKAVIYEGAYIGDETAFVSSMKHGDIIAEESGGIWMINEISFNTDQELTKVVLVGLEDDAYPCLETFESDTWSSKLVVPLPPVSGNYALESSDGVVSWVAKAE